MSTATTVVSGVCLRCGRRLVRLEGGRGNVHQDSGMVRCEPVPTHECTVCKRPDMIQCSEVECPNLLHPGCAIYCTCHGGAVCPEHGGDDGLCNRCAARDEGWPALAPEYDPEVEGVG